MSTTPTDQAKGQQGFVLSGYRWGLLGWCKLWVQGVTNIECQTPSAGVQEGSVLGL